MSKMSKKVKDMNNTDISDVSKNIVRNFMNGESFTVNPLLTLKMISAASIFSEPSYYRGSDDSLRNDDIPSYVYNSIIFSDLYDGKTTTQIMEEAIDKALDYDFFETLKWAYQLRNVYNMRLNPQVIMVRAAIHPKRTQFTHDYPGVFGGVNSDVMHRPDEPMTQMAYYLYINGGKKNGIPTILKKSWAKKMSTFSAYEVNKYKNSEIGMINGVRLCHANSSIINELMATGTVEVSEDESTWENLRSAGHDWKYILDTVNMGHMALLRNLRGVFSEIGDRDVLDKYLDNLVGGVAKGRQFPFRYYSAFKNIGNDVSYCTNIKNALEKCIDISAGSLPRLKGRTMALSDNSGSAWGTFTSEYGSVTIAEIDNLSSVLAAACSDEGYVGKFGDRLVVRRISKDNILQQAMDITNNQYSDVGGNTEGGIWEFFKKAINEKEHWDNIFIYSDQQAGHGGLYGTDEQSYEYRFDYGVLKGYRHYINVFDLVQEYRRKVNPKVNVFSVQTAAYTNNVIPEMAYRTDILYGWTGKELQYSAMKIKLWDEIERSDNNV